MEQATGVVNVDTKYPIDTQGTAGDLSGTGSQALSVVQDASPYSYVGQGTSDPFTSMHTQLSDRMYRHLQHCKSVSLLP